jgi:hypothetical protein
MSVFDLPAPAAVAEHFCAALGQARCDAEPYVHWSLSDALPEIVAANIIMLPIKPPLIDECGGVRDLNDNNNKRSFFTPKLQAGFPVCAVLSQALQRPEVARLCAKTFNIEVEGSYLRTEYIQDTDGAWLKPHHDIPEKLFSMVIYLCTGPESIDWGTDIYDHQRKWVGRATPTFNSAVVFVPGEHTWHGFDKRPIIGVRRLMEINYVRPNWRDRDQLSFPNRPITVG